MFFVSCGESRRESFRVCYTYMLKRIELPHEAKILFCATQSIDVLANDTRDET